MARLFCAILKVIVAVALILRTSLLALNTEDNLKECETNPTGRHIEFCGWELGASYSKQMIYDCYNKTPELKEIVPMRKMLYVTLLYHLIAADDIKKNHWRKRMLPYLGMHSTKRLLWITRPGGSQEYYQLLITCPVFTEKQACNVKAMYSRGNAILVQF